MAQHGVGMESKEVRGIGGVCGMECVVRMHALRRTPSSSARVLPATVLDASHPTPPPLTSPVSLPPSAPRPRSRCRPTVAA